VVGDRREEEKAYAVKIVRGEDEEHGPDLG